MMHITAVFSVYFILILILLQLLFASSYSIFDRKFSRDKNFGHDLTSFNMNENENYTVSEEFIDTIFKQNEKLQKNHESAFRIERDTVSSNYDYEMFVPYNETDNFLENVENYPKADIIEALANAGDTFDDYFSLESDSNIVVTYRFDSAETISVCESHKKTHFPQTFKNKDGYFNYIVNINDERFRQPLSVEICSGGVNTSCKFEGTLANGYGSICVQKFTTKKLLTFDSRLKKLKLIDYEVPICCECKLYTIENRQ